METSRKVRVGRRAVAVCIMTLCALYGPLAGQDLEGRVLEAGSEQGVAGAVVRLVDTEGDVDVLTLSDSAGAYRLSTPGPGDYHLEVEAFGYAPLRSHLLAVGEGDSYAVDVELTPTPVPISGFEITADRLQELENSLRLMIGVHPRSLRYEPMLRPEIQDHIAQAHGLTDLVRWSNTASVVTRRTTDGPCFQWRNRHCLPVYLNGAVVAPEMIPVLPLEMLEMIVVMTPGDSIAYPGGAVLLYTSAWIG